MAHTDQYTAEKLAHEAAAKAIEGLATNLSNVDGSKNGNHLATVYEMVFDKIFSKLNGGRNPD